MKRLLPIFLVAVMVLCLTACNQDVLSMVGGFMDKLGNNIYGITPDMSDVNSVTGEKLDSLFAGEGGKIDSEAAKDILNSIADLKSSSQKTEALKEQLKETLPKEQADAVKKTVGETLGKASENLDTALEGKELSESQQAMVDKVKEVLGSVENGIPDAGELNKADLVTVAALSTIADMASKIATQVSENEDLLKDPDELKKLVEPGLAALDTIKMVSDVGSINLVNEDLMDALIDALLGGDKKNGEAHGVKSYAMASNVRYIARMDEPMGVQDSENLIKLTDEQKEYLAMLSDTVRSLLNLITKDSKFDDVKFKAFVSQASAIRASYELITLPYIPSNAKKLDDFRDMLNVKSNLKMTIDDLVLYTICMAVTEVGEAGDLVEDLGNYINKAYECLIDLENKADQLTGLTNEVMEKLKKVLNDNKDNWTVIGTFGVLMVDSNSTNLLKAVTKADNYPDMVRALFNLADGEGK